MSAHLKEYQRRYAQPAGETESGPSCWEVVCAFAVRPEERKFSDNFLTRKLSLPARALNALDNGEVATVGQLRRTRDSRLLLMGNFGRQSLRKIREQVPFELRQSESEFEPRLDLYFSRRDA